MNWVDYAIMSVMGLSILISFIRGFVREVLSLVAWVVALWVTFHFAHAMSKALAPHIAHDKLRMVVGIVILFVCSLILMAIFNHFIGYLIDKTGLSGTDRLLGLFFGAARGTLLIGVFVLLINITPMQKEMWWQTSYFAPHFKTVATFLEKIVAHYVPQYEAMKATLEKQGEAASAPPAAAPTPQPVVAPSST